MADLKEMIVNALRGSGQDAVPFGVGGPAEPAIESGLPSIVGGVAKGAYGTIENLIDSVKQSDPYDVRGSNERMVGPAFDTAVSLAGIGTPLAASGAAGIFGGKLAKTADIDKLMFANKGYAAGQPMSYIREETGWARDPTDNKWKFEISDDKSKMHPKGLDYSKEGRFFGGTSGSLFDHPDMYAAYPELANNKAYSTVLRNPRNGIGTGEFNPNPVGPVKVISASANNARNMRSVMLHENQHAIQRLENFGPGGSPQHIADLKAHLPEKLPLNEENTSPFDMYHRLSGEVESRNVQKRMDFTPLQRRLIHPWTTQDVPYNEQLLRDPTRDFVKALRHLK